MNRATDRPSYQLLAATQTGLIRMKVHETLFVAFHLELQTVFLLLHSAPASFLSHASFPCNLYVPLSASLSQTIYLSVCWFVFLFLSLFLSSVVSLQLSVFLSSCPFASLSLCVSTQLYVSSPSLFVSLFVFLSF